MISILTRSDNRSKDKYFILVEGEKVSSHSAIGSLVKRINEDYVECQRIFEPDHEQEKAGYKALADHEQDSIEELLLDAFRSEDNPLDTEDIFYEH